MADHRGRIETSELLAEAGWLRAFSRTLADPELALDLEQETMRIALERPPLTGSGLRPWLRTVVLNLRRRARRDRATRRYYEAQAARPEVDSEEETSQRLELQALIVDALAGLEEPLRTAIRLRHLDGHPYAVVATRMGTSELVARKRVSRGLVRLREQLDKKSDGGLGWRAAVLAVAQDLSTPLDPALATTTTGAFKVALTRSDPLLWGAMMTTGTKLGIAAMVTLLVGGLVWNETRGGATEMARAEPQVVSAVSPARELDGAPNAIDLVIAEQRRVALTSHATPNPPTQDSKSSVHSPAPAWGHLELTIVDDKTDRPLPALFLEFEEASSPLPISEPAGEPDGSTRGWPSETDGKGQISGEVQPGVALSMEVNGIGCTGPLTTLEIPPFGAGERRELELRLDAAQLPKFWVRVVGQADQRPVPDADLWEVDVYGQRLFLVDSVDESYWDDRQPFARTDGNGYSALPVGRMVQKRFMATAPGRGRALFTREVKAERREAAFEIVLPDLAALSVEVVDAKQAPLEGVTVRLVFEGEDSMNTIAIGRSYWQHTATRVSDARGHAQFNRLNASQEIRAELRYPGANSIWQPIAESIPALAPGEKRTLVLVAHAVTDVHGWVVDQYGAPSVGAKMLLFPESGELGAYITHGRESSATRRAIADRDGKFRWEGVPAGRWLAVPQMERTFMPSNEDEGLDMSELYAPMPTAFELKGTLPIHELKAVLWRGLYVSGVVLDPEGEPCGDAYVRIDLGSMEYLTRQRVRDDGTFIVGPLPDVPVRVSVDDFGRDLSSQVLDVHAGDADVILRLVQTGCLPIRTVISADGSDCVSTLTAWRTDATGQVVEAIGYAPGTPSCSWCGLRAGTWHLLARGPGELIGHASGIEIRDGETADALEIRLSPGGALTLGRAPSLEKGKRRCLVFAAGTPVGECRLAPGDSVQLFLPPGKLEVVDFDHVGRALPPHPIQVRALEHVEFQLR